MFSPSTNGCNPICATCLGPNDNHCVTCPDSATSFRITNPNADHECPCSLGYYGIVGVVNCILCHPSCEGCSNAGPTFCTSCNEITRGTI